MNPWQPEPWRVITSERETEDTLTLTLQHHTTPNQAVCAKPGQFNMVYCLGLGEIPISFSQIQPHTIAHTIRGVGAVSKALIALPPGSCLGIRGPYGNGWPMDDLLGKDICLVAGGVGLAPLKPVLDQICEQRDTYGKVTLIYGCRTPKASLFQENRVYWNSHNIQIDVVVDCPDPHWRGHVGTVIDRLQRLSLDSARTIALLCGPEIMMRYASQHLMQQHQLPSTQLFVSLERNMKCALGWCGHCQLYGALLCRNGPVYPYERVQASLSIASL